jgi:predicted ATPase
MHCVVITGGPGVGKTTLLAELKRLGYATVEESARAVIKERLARGLSPRPEPSAFAREILRRDIEKYLGCARAAAWTFFDRGVLEAIAMLDETLPIGARELASLLQTYPFHRTVFLLPPWRAIYVTDAERDQSFEDTVSVHGKVQAWYRACGYTLHEVPCLPAAARAAYVLSVLSRRETT